MHTRRGGWITSIVIYGSPYSFHTDGTRRPGPCGREDCGFVVDGDPDTCAICYEALATAERLRQVKPMVSPLSV